MIYIERPMQKSQIDTFCMSMFKKYKNISILCDKALADKILARANGNWDEISIDFRTENELYIVSKIKGKVLICEPAKNEFGFKDTTNEYIILTNSEKLSEDDQSHFLEEKTMWLLGLREQGLLIGSAYLEFGNELPFYEKFR